MVLLKRKFRMIQSSEEYDDSDGFISIELFSAGLDPFRVAPGDKMPLPWPHVRHSGRCKISSILDTLDGEIRAILKTQGISVQSIRVDRLSPRYSMDSVKETVVISTKDEPSDPTIAWKRAANEISHLVEVATIGADIPFRLEIRNYDLMYRDTSTPIPSDSTDLPHLLQIQPAVNEMVKNMLSSLWTSVAFHMRGPRERSENRTPTVMISVKPGTRGAWLHYAEMFHRKIGELLDTTQDFPLAIEFCTTLIYPSTTAGDDPVPVFLGDLSSSAQIGASVGPRSSQDAGSLGVWVSFQPPGNSEKKKCFITCYHVIACGDPTYRSSNHNVGIGLNGRPIQSGFQDSFLITVKTNYFSVELALNFVRSNLHDFLTGERLTPKPLT